MLERKRPHLLRQADGEAAGLRSERLAAAAEDRRFLAAVTRAARALLAIELGGRRVDLGAVLAVRGAGPVLTELVAHHALQDVGARLKTEDVVGQLHGAHLLGVESGDVGFHHSWLPPSAALVAAGSALSAFSDLAFFASCGCSPLRNAPGFGAASGKE